MFFSNSLLAVLAVHLLGAFAQDAGQDQPITPVEQAKVNADITATFPDSDILGVKLINGRPTNALINIVNNEAGKIQFAFVSGALHHTDVLPEDAPAYQSIVRNLTAVQYNVEVAAGEKTSLPFSFALDMHPQDVRVQLHALVVSSTGAIVQVPIYDDKATIVEPPVSFFDPQIIFLYLVLSAGLAGTLYFVYKTWIETLFPQAKRAPKTRAKRIDTIAPETVGVAAATGTDKSYDENWIPDGHMNRPAAKRVKSSASAKTKKFE